MESNEIFYELNARHFVVHLEEPKFDHELRGAAYPIFRWTVVGSGELGWSYESVSSAVGSEELTDDCRVLFEFIFCWRGVWEGRVYFKDDEYWSEEMRVMADLWGLIEEELKRRLRNNGYGQED